MPAFRNPVVPGFSPMGRLVAGIFAFLAAQLLLASPAAAQPHCAWFGSRPLCNGQCPSDYVYTGRREGCLTGSRRFCCHRRYVQAAEGRANCKWVGNPGSMLYVCDDPEAVHYSAVAIDGRGRWGASIQPPAFNGPSYTIRYAEADARRRCGDGCRVAISGKGRCVAVAESRAGGYWVGYSHGTTRLFVVEQARKGCSARAPAGTCSLIHVNCI